MKKLDNIKGETTASELSRREVLGYSLIGASGLALAGMAGPAFAKNAKPSGQVILGISQEPTVFNPHMLHIEVDEGIYMAVFDPLWNVDPDGTFSPALAVEVPTTANGGISADGTVWTIKLRKGVKWHDGTPFTAEDVKYTLELQTDPNFRAARRSGHELITKIEVLSATEVRWTMSKAYAPYMAIMAWTFMVPKHLLGAADDPNTAPFNQAPVGTGPFKWGSRAPGDNIQLEANKDYYGEGPYLERVIIKYIPDLTVLYTQFKTGDIDVIGLQGIAPDHFKEATSLPGRVVKVVPRGTVETLSLNLGNPILADKAVREAMYLGVDKVSIVDALYYGLPTPTESYMPQQSYYFNKSLPAHQYNPGKAKKILDDAGWAVGSDGTRAKDGVRLSVTCSTTAGNHTREQMQQFLQQSWAEIGIEMKISNLPPAVMWGEHWMMSKYDVAVAGISFLTGPDPDTTDYFSSKAIGAQGGSGQNTWQFKNARIDELLESGGSTITPSERRPIYQEIQSIIREELPFLPLFQYTVLRGYKEGMKGFKPNINVRVTYWNMGTWSWS